MKNSTIILVDDDVFLLGMYRKKFEGAGAAVDSYSSSTEALNKIRGGATPDILVLDMIMPQMDGLELLEAIRKENLTPKSTVIMLTNESDPAKVEKAKSLGASGYIVKSTSIPSEVVEKTMEIAENHQKTLND
jgi:two-component system, chemotaxis family, chemotaxis protein CheY